MEELQAPSRGNRCAHADTGIVFKERVLTAVEETRAPEPCCHIPSMQCVAPSVRWHISGTREARTFPADVGRFSVF